MATRVKAYIMRDGYGCYRIFCQRSKRKWWFELGKHKKTDAAFERAYLDKTLQWEAQIVDKQKIFPKM